jgi:hypothetical protein
VWDLGGGEYDVPLIPCMRKDIWSEWCSVRKLVLIKYFVESQQQRRA